MNLTIVTIADRNIANKERLHLSVLAAANLSFYVVLETVRQLNGISSGSRRAYWFPPVLVKPGDNVVLYTGPGNQHSTARVDGGTDHFFYWGLHQTAFGNSLSSAVLFEVSNWKASI